MSPFSAFVLFASVSAGTSIGYLKPLASPVAAPTFLAVPPSPNGLTLYDEKGDVVARCEKKDDGFGNCKMEPGFTLDDLMNAWVHAYKEMQTAK
ncbi:MAG TPA: hypothetical protein VKB38_08340 [Terracidiphilus sp.]|nr:hypothetical protein [Terracidiphilus sp.]